METTLESVRISEGLKTATIDFNETAAFTLIFNTGGATIVFNAGASGREIVEALRGYAQEIETAVELAGKKKPGEGGQKNAE